MVYKLFLGNTDTGRDLDFMKKVELLAPAGNFDALTGALMAGADAVYLGGNAFGARAYAENFTEGQIIEGIQLAHLMQRKIYLTVNTLVKDNELTRLYDFLLPFYKNGLDGVIIQDLGVFSFIKRHFPGLELHVSTQMTITGSYGAKMLKENGAVRIVPARELSLTEIKEIKKAVDIEIEAFIHGAMCYCYSGQCLFSSILGGRSGNRGRCAQPCRLPYRIESGKEHYPLSMKDMCTLTILPELIEAGIDSFKIEGRMKKPEYAAGVTALYRKYIDLYYKNPNAYYVDERDIEYLKKLYIRSDIQEGYYHLHNGKEMITITSPAYEGSDDYLLKQIRAAYLERTPEVGITAHAQLFKNKPAQLSVFYEDKQACIEGVVVQQAIKSPLSRDKIIEQLSKSGSTIFKMSDIIIEMDDDIFMPVSDLNRLRRDALEELKNNILSEKNNHRVLKLPIDKKSNECSEQVFTKDTSLIQTEIHVLAKNIEQIIVAAKEKVNRIYVDISDLTTEKISELEACKKNYSCSFYLCFPFVLRNINFKLAEDLYTLLQRPLFDGVLARNIETLSFLLHHGNQKPIVCDSNLYTFNQEALQFFHSMATETYLPIELNMYEWKKLLRNNQYNDVSTQIYGRLPMMITANCVNKTAGKCKKQNGYTKLTDRYGKVFPVYSDCTCCYNIIYNSVPLSLHKLWDKKDKQLPFSALRLDFTIESVTETKKIIQYFNELYSQYREPFYKEFTTGHYKRGVE